MTELRTPGNVEIIKRLVTSLIIILLQDLR